MLRTVTRRLTYANVLVTLALFVALGGTAVAAKQYVLTSTSQVKPSVLKQLKGKRGATGRAGAAGAQGPVGPQGATGAAGATGPAGRDGTPADVAPGTPIAFSPSAAGACNAGRLCAPYATGDGEQIHPAEVYKSADGTVVLRGGIYVPLPNSNPARNTTILVLPEGYRPLNGARAFPVVTYGEAAGTLRIFADGSVKVLAGSTAYVSLDGISFLP